ncbi:MAG: aminotransferase class I/II-fold pyridoxal phosphate-dependent enzyme [Microbacterium sp.]|uniref:aminotransferase class I/II-fold pyridoxal phosphate-dependent enzyme n=1 Tax=Microbacterium sp. TaxID=51671 RepID=UPI003A844E2E
MSSAPVPGISARDPRGLAADAPLLDGWLRFTGGLERGEIAPFSVPGHKHRTDLVGDVIRGDVPLYAGLAPVKDTDAVLADAEARAAAAWGADWARLSVGGSTHANQASILALGRPGQPVVVSRTLHRSVLLGIVLAGLRPVWVRPEVDPVTGLPGAVPVAAVERALAAHPDACGVLVGDPSYVGTMSDVEGLARAAHAAGVPLVVDAAWAAYLGFSPRVPGHALQRGADALITSAHKALPSWTQAALVVARTTRDGGLLDPDRLDRAFEATHTTSPSGAILASVDAARALLQRDGEALVGRLVDLVAAARARLAAVDGLAVLTDSSALVVDPTKLVLLPAGTGAHGHAIERDLLATGIPLEMADRDILVPMVTMADDAASVDRLVGQLIAAVERHRGTPRRVEPSPAWTVDAETALDPRTAFFAAHETVDADAAVGRVCAELIAPYPPGVPALAPGEVVTAGTLEALRAVRADGGRIAYAADPTLATLQVVVG